MHDHQRRFIDLALDRQVLRFGEFTLKSGRISPYFFNAGLFNSGAALATLGACYADALLTANLDFDMLFGPAYKGIPLATVTATALAARGRDVPVAFNRKEAKSHGEGGQLIGAPIAGRVLIVDDVITAGTAIREALEIIRGAGGEACGVLIALDRQERGQTGARSAAEEVAEQFGLPVLAIAGLDDLLEYADQEPADQEPTDQASADNHPAIADYKPALLAYRARYGRHAAVKSGDLP